MSSQYYYGNALKFYIIDIIHVGKIIITILTRISTLVFLFKK